MELILGNVLIKVFIYGNILSLLLSRFFNIRINKNILCCGIFGFSGKTGKKVSEKLKGKIPKNLSTIQIQKRIPVYVYDKKDILIDEFVSITEASKKYPCVQSNMGKRMKRKGFFFSPIKLT